MGDAIIDPAETRRVISEVCKQRIIRVNGQSLKRVYSKYDLVYGGLTKFG